MAVLFEDLFGNGFYAYDGIGELIVGNGWIPWWSEHDTRPEYRDAAPFENRIHSGEHAQQWLIVTTNTRRGFINKRKFVE